MKKHFAILLAATVTLASVPSLNVFADETVPQETSEVREIIEEDKTAFSIEDNAEIPEEESKEIIAPSEEIFGTKEEVSEISELGLINGANNPANNPGEYEYFYAENSDGTLTINWVEGPETGNISIPGYINNKQVTVIGKSAFCGFRQHTGTLTIPEGIRVIEETAFEGCRNFTGDLRIPDSVVEIGKSAFEGCHGFDGNLTLGNNLTKIGDNAFHECVYLSGDLKIPDKVTSIGNKAFWGCFSFNGELTLPDNISFIGERAFCACEELTGSLILPDSLQYIGDYAFAGCDVTGDLNIPNGISYIGEGAFDGLNMMTGKLTLPDDLNQIKDYTFLDNGFTGGLVIPDGVTSIGRGAFYNSGNNGRFTSLEIPSSVTSIGDVAFKGNHKITSIKNDSAVTIPAEDILANENEYFVSSSGQTVGYNDVIEKGSYTKKISVPVTGVTLSPSSIAMYEKETATLVALVTPSDATNKDISWISNNEQVAIVDSSGVVTGISSGTAAITVKTADGGMTATCNVTVMNPSPSATTIQSVSNTEKGIKVIWKKIDGVNGYYLYRSDNGGKYAKIATVTGGSYADNKATKNGTKYSYKVYAYKTINNRSYNSIASPEKTYYRLSQSKVKSVKSIDKKALKVTWNKNSKGSGYQIQYSTNKNFKSAKTVTVTSANTASKKITGLKKGKTYYVRIRPYKKVKTTKHYGAWNNYSVGVKVKK